MGVLEITHLRLKAGIESTDPALVNNLQNIRAQLKTNSRFYIDVKDSSKLYILGLWPTLEAHHAFLASPDRGRVLGPQEGQTEFVWGVHVDDVSNMDDLPLEADVMCVRRTVCREDGRASMEEQLHGEVDRLKRKFGNSAVLYKQRLDTVAGEVEAILLFGISNDYDVSNVKDRLSKDCGALLRTEEWQAKDLERKVKLLKG